MIQYYSNVPFLYAEKIKLNFIPGIENYLKLAKYTYPQVGLTDRTGLSMPFETVDDTVPKFNNKFNLSYEDCIMDTMNELDSLHIRTGKKFRLMYSGGIDTVAIFSAFVDYYGIDSTRKILEISCSKESMIECPELWNDYIRRYNFDLHNSHDHSEQWLDNRIILTGENNDVLFSNMYYPEYCGEQDLYKMPSLRDIAYFLSKNNISDDSLYAAEKLIEMADRSPVPITNNYLFYWYIDFVTLWTGLSLSPLSQSKEGILPSNFLKDTFRPFFNSDKFQHWSLHFHLNFPDSFGEISNYKKICKDFIYDKLKLETYKHKYKFPSLPVIHTFRRSAYFIDADLVLHRRLEDFADHIKFNNDFI